MNIKDRNLEDEFTFKTSRSSGKGGQNVNKVSTKVELYFNIKNSAILTEEEKLTISNKIKSKIDKNGVLRIVSQSERSQMMNKKKVINKFYEIITKALKKKRARKKTKPTEVSKEKRLSSKKTVSEKKRLRNEPIIEE